MKCKKCSGLMVLQSFFDHFLNFEGWKCLNCGKIIAKKRVIGIGLLAIKGFCGIFLSFGPGYFPISGRNFCVSESELLRSQVGMSCCVVLLEVGL